MNKYILDLIRNNSRTIFKGMSLPQVKATTEVIRGLYTASRPILRHLAQDLKKTAKKQGEKYSYHLGRIDLKAKIEDWILKRVKSEIKRNTIIAYDLTDIAKTASKKMAKLSRVWDGSLRKAVPGFLLHGVGVNNFLLKLEVHEGNEKTTNQVRKAIIETLAKTFHFLGIWVFDRGNDDKAFFVFLRQTLSLQFIARLRKNRQVVMKETGALLRVDEIPVGQHRVYLRNAHNTKVDIKNEYLLVVSKHLENKQAIRLLAYLKDEYTSEQVVTMYLERWGIENSFKRAKQLFALEKIRVLDYRKFVNLIALIQFVTNLSSMLFLTIQKLTNSLISGVLLAYRRFMKIRSLTFNLSSFISYLQFSLQPFVSQPQKPPPEQLPLLSRRCLGKLGPS